MTVDTLEFKFSGDASGAVAAIDKVLAKTDALRAKEESLKAAMKWVNQETAEGQKLFAALSSELGQVTGSLNTMSASGQKASNVSQQLHEHMSKTRAVMGSLTQAAGATGGSLAMVANAGGGIAQAFATGGPLAAGLAAAVVGVGMLNDALDRYAAASDRAATSELVKSMATIAAGSAVSRALVDRTAQLKEELGITTKLERLQQEKIALDEKERSIQAVLKSTKPRTADELAALPGYKKSLIDVRDQRFLIEQAIEKEVEAQQKALDVQEKALEAAEKQKKAADDLLRLTRARAGLEEANAAAALAAEDRALGLDNPDPGAGLFGNQTPVASTEWINALNEMIRSAPTAEFTNGIIEGAIALEDLSRAAESASDGLQAGLQGNALSAVTSLASGDLRGVGAAAGAGLGAVAGANIAQAMPGVDPAMAQQLGGALGGIVGGALGEAGNSLMEAIAQVGEKMGALAPIVDAAGIVVAQLEPLWQTVADIGSVVADSLLYLSPLVRLLAEAVNFVVAPLGGMAEMLHDVMQDGLVPFAIGMTKAINAIIDAVNAVSRWTNDTFGTDIDMLGHVIVNDLIGPVEDAGTAIRENLTDEFVNLPPGFKTSGAIFAATDVGAGPASGGGGLNIGTVNIVARGSAADELESIRDRSRYGSSTIIGGRNTVTDRRN